MQLTEKQEQILLKIIHTQETYTSLVPPQEEEAKLRTMRMYPSQIVEFSAFCKKNRITQQKALFQAIQFYMKNFYDINEMEE